MRNQRLIVVVIIIVVVVVEFLAAGVNLQRICTGEEFRRSCKTDRKREIRDSVAGNIGIEDIGR